MAEQFEKYHGTGNDFILLRGRGPRQVWSADHVAQACHRQLGIGADGLMVLWDSAEADFHLDYYNEDGALGSLCGNGSRCAVAYAYAHGLFIGSTCHFFAADGLHTAFRHENGLVTVEFTPAGRPVPQWEGFYLDTGSPHHIAMVAQVADIPVLQEGPALRYGPYAHQGGANINWISPTGPDGTWEIRTYERGVENETLSCGTGAVAAALTLHALKGCTSPVSLYARGGRLDIAFEVADQAYTDIQLTGPATHVYTGTWPW